MYYRICCTAAQACTFEKACEYVHIGVCENAENAAPNTTRCICGGTLANDHGDRRMPRMRFLNDSHGRHGRSSVRRHQAGAPTIRHMYM